MPPSGSTEARGPGCRSTWGVACSGSRGSRRRSWGSAWPLAPRASSSRRDPRTVTTDDRAHPRGPDGRSTDWPRGGGLPEWLASTLNHCTQCGGRLELGPVPGEERQRLVCLDCGHISYVNPRLVVSTIPVTEAGEVLLIRRGFE